MASKTNNESGVDAFSVVLEKLESNKYYSVIKQHLNDVSTTIKHDLQEVQAERFLSWARADRNLKVIGVDVPGGVLPNGYTGVLNDIRVFVKYGPDDKVYDNNKDIRERVARGNSILVLSGKCPRTFCALQAMKKFTGGLGDDDDRESGDMMVWQKYFTKPLEETDVIISTGKANGEAAHLSCIQLDGEYIMCGGSKNVHLLFRNKADIAKYVEPRYRIATEICNTVMEFLDEMSEEQRTLLMAFLVASRYTAVFEILSPLHQHVVNLSYLQRPALKFITWTSCELEPSVQLKHLNVVPPHVGIELARVLGLDPVSYNVVSMKELDSYMKQIRQNFNEEGEVLYFLDADSRVIGLLKKKTTWYIMCRAIREKVKTAVRQMISNPDKFSKQRSLNQVEKRMREIRTWLNLDEVTTKEWMTLGTDCLKWVFRQVEDNKYSKEQIADMFPVYWADFLQATGSTDRISVSMGNSSEGACGSGDSTGDSAGNSGANKKPSEDLKKADDNTDNVESDSLEQGTDS